MEKRGVKKKFTNDRPTCRYKNLFQRRDTEMMMFKSLFALIYDVYSTTVYGMSVLQESQITPQAFIRTF